MLSSDTDISLSYSRDGPIYSGTQLTLTCHIDYPTVVGAQISADWLDANRQEISGERFITSDLVAVGSSGYSTTLTIHPLNTSDSGPGAFLCVFAVNSVQKLEAISQLSVQGNLGILILVTCINYHIVQ